MLELYYHLHDDESQKAMQALANSTLSGGNFKGQPSPHEGKMRAKAQSKIEKTPQVPEMQILMSAINCVTERGGFEPPVRFPAHTLSKGAR